MFNRWYFQTDFLEWKLLYFDENVIKICSPGSNSQYSSIGLDDGSAPVRLSLMKHIYIYASLSLNVLTHGGHSNIAEIFQVIFGQQCMLQFWTLITEDNDM